MTFEFTVHPGFNFIKSFGEHFNIPVKDDTLILPVSMGKGFIRFKEIEPGVKFALHHYTMSEDFHLIRKSPQENHDIVSIVFNSNEIPRDVTPDRQTAIQFLKNNGSSIQIASSALSTETIFPGGVEIYFGVIGIRREVLMTALGLDNVRGPLEMILHGDGLFFYHEKMVPDILRTLKQLSEVSDEDALSALYHKIKIHELIYLLFHKLLDRGNDKQRPVNKADIDKLAAIRTAILADLSQPPELSALAKMSGMSETKMKQLFKQTFGDTIYNYYQNERMQEAGFLLTQAGYSVSEAGYQLGFSNLSHFSRLFEKHFGATPKKYAAAG
ncbi:helix-turn-helix domain-containing protein [Dinghuibacter silviterrae]|uniref:AraC family transcriptional regulator n=1 Tax=Dinghuibacter silviterrae TaxID=1539049 RepID=A0A4R8DTE2_9BACT|nr:helix-turn-helix domain-containing protein [Dinghuibacter silviterrae]TDX01550.1 AraC family transcriptional regulator [Dinghuibacter silviterrae]